MYRPQTRRRPQSNRFDTVAGPFQQQSGLPFANVLNSQTIERAFVRHNGLFAEEEIFSTPLLLWAFLAQGK